MSFDVSGDPRRPRRSRRPGTASYPARPISLGFTNITFDFVGDGRSLDTADSSFATDGTGLFLDQVSVTPTPAQRPRRTERDHLVRRFETADTHTASFMPQDSDYVGTFSLDPVSESGGSGSVAWHFTVDNADIQFLAQGQSLTQVYTVLVTDATAPPPSRMSPSRSTGATTRRRRTTTMSSPMSAPTARRHPRLGAGRQRHRPGYDWTASVGSIT